MNDQSPEAVAATGRPKQWSLAVGVVGLGLCAMGGGGNPAAFFRAYLAAYMFFLGIALGGMVVLMVYHLTGGSWGLMLRRILEAAMRTLPLLVVLFLPIALGLGYLYPWAQPGLIAESPKLQYQQFYLRPTYFWIRAAVYFALWLGMAFWLDRWSREQDRTGNPRLAWKSLQLSAFGAVIYGISIHFASVDWSMSLQPMFHSSIWGPLTAAGQLLSAFAVALVVLALRIDRPPLAEVASRKVRYDLGSLLLTLLILWAYLAWFQFMLVWIANMPVDVIYYQPRTSPFWKAVIGAIAVLHFAVPFFLLLMRPIKRNSRAVAWIAGLILVMQMAFMDYQILPGMVGTPGAVGSRLWIDLLMPLGIGGIWLAYFLWQLERRPLLPLNDYNRQSALHLRRLDEEEAAREEAWADE
jgi:hypothetical protein